MKTRRQIGEMQVYYSYEERLHSSLLKGRFCHGEGYRLGDKLQKCRGAGKKCEQARACLFFDPCCDACNRIKNSTLISECVQDYVNKYFIPIKYESGADSDQFMRFCVTAKPAIIVFDAEGTEIFRKIGCFEPELFIKKLAMAIKKAAHRAARCRGGSLDSGHDGYLSPFTILLTDV